MDHPTRFPILGSAISKCSSAPAARENRAGPERRGRSAAGRAAPQSRRGRDLERASGRGRRELTIMVHMSIRALSACTLVLAIAPALFAADTVVVEQIVAKVNGDIITRSELDLLRKQLAAELQQRGGTAVQIRDQMKDHEKDMLREKIDSLLLIQRGKRRSSQMFRSL